MSPSGPGTAASPWASIANSTSTPPVLATARPWPSSSWSGCVEQRHLHLQRLEDLVERRLQLLLEGATRRGAEHQPVLGDLGGDAADGHVADLHRRRPRSGGPGRRRWRGTWRGATRCARARRAAGCPTAPPRTGPPARPARCAGWCGWWRCRWRTRWGRARAARGAAASPPRRPAAPRPARLPWRPWSTRRRGRRAPWRPRHRPTPGRSARRGRRRRRSTWSGVVESATTDRG